MDCRLFLFPVFSHPMDIIVCLFFILFLFFLFLLFFFRFRFFATVVLFLPSRWKTMLIVHRCQDSASHAGAFFFFFFCIPALFSGLLFLFFFHRVVFLLFGFIYLFISLGRNAVSRVVCCFSFIFYHENWSPTIFRRCVFYYFSLLFFFIRLWFLFGSCVIFVGRERREQADLVEQRKSSSIQVFTAGASVTMETLKLSPGLLLLFIVLLLFFVVIISSHLSLTLYLIDISISIYLVFIPPSCLSSFVSTCATPCVCVFVIVIDGVHYELEWLERRRFSSHSTLSILFLTWLSRMLLVWTSWFNFLLPVANRRICRIKKKKLRKEDDETQQTDTHTNQQRIKKKNPFSTRCRCCARPC